MRFVGDGVNGLQGYCSRLCQLQNQHIQYISHLKNTQILNETKIKELNSKIITLTQLNENLKALKETPIGLRARIKQMKGIHNLTESSGQRKKRMKLAIGIM